MFFSVTGLRVSCAVLGLSRTAFEKILKRKDFDLSTGSLKTKISSGRFLPGVSTSVDSRMLLKSRLS